MGRIGNLISTVKNWQSGSWSTTNFVPELPYWAPDHPLNQAAYNSEGLLPGRERIENNFEAYVYGAYKACGPVFSCIQARQMVFSEATFKYKSLIDGKLHGDQGLALLENPWPGGTTGELLGRMEQDASLAGNSWWTLTNDAGQYGNAARGGEGLRLCHMRPDWVTMVIGSKSGDTRALDAKLVGVMYQPLANYGYSGEADVGPSILLMMDEVAHYSPTPDPIARFRGMSWITPVLRDVEADKSALKHKGAFYDNAAVPNMSISFDKDVTREDFDEFVEAFKGNHTGSWNAYKTLFLMGGADVTPLTHDFNQLDFTQTVGKGESRIASAAGVPSSWVGFSEGLQGSSLNAGNMAANRRRFADGTIRPLWRMAVASLAVLVTVPTGSKLWWDETDIAFLREDQRDRAEIMRIDMTAIDSAIRSGYEPDAAVDAVYANDLTKLMGAHTGLVSVQMQPPVDPDSDHEETEAQVRVLELQATTIVALCNAGFTPESVVAAVTADDLTKLVERPDTPPDTWSPGGRPLMPATPPGAAPAAPGAAPAAPGAKPPAPAKPTAVKPPAPGKTNPGGGGNG